MPIKVKQNLPAQHILEQENIFVMTEQRAMTQDIRPLNVLVLNLMPTKIVTETQLLRKLSNTPLQIQVEFLQTVTYKSQHTDSSHLDEFYKSFDEVKDHFYDGLIITGAPLDFIDYEDVDYWDEVCKIMEWSKKHVHCTFHLCWGAYAGLYYHYGIRKRDRIPKLSGIYKHHILKKNAPLFRGFDDVFYAPHSRATEITKEQILAELFPMAEKLQQLRKETKEQNKELQGAVNFLYKALFAIGNYVGEKSLQSVVQEMNTLFVELENVLK